MITSKGRLYALNVLLFYQKDFYLTNSKPWNMESGLWSLVFPWAWGRPALLLLVWLCTRPPTDSYLIAAGYLMVVGGCGVGLAVAGLVVPRVLLGVLCGFGTLGSCFQV